MDISISARDGLYRKGAVFTVLSILVSSLLLITFFSSVERPVDEGVDQVNLRVSLTNHYIQQSDKYIRNALHSGSAATFPFMISKMAGNDAFFSDFNAEFRSCLLHGNMRKPGDEDNMNMVDCANGSNINDILRDIEGFLKKSSGIAMNISVKNITLSQDVLSGPFNIRVTADVEINASDGYAEWFATKEVRYSFDIIGLEDPIYSINDNDIVNEHGYNNTIFFNDSLTTFLIGPPATLNEITKQRAYFQYDLAPSFLQRLNNNLSASCSGCGIASLVSPLNSTSIKELSNLDFIFWRNNTCHLANPYVKIRFDDVPQNKEIQYAIIPMDLAEKAKIEESNYTKLNLC